MRYAGNCPTDNFSTNQPLYTDMQSSYRRPGNENNTSDILGNARKEMDQNMNLYE
jgi:hypothetical protein